MSLRLAGPLRVVLDTARTSVRCVALAEKITAECGIASTERVSGMLANLLRHSMCDQR